MTAKNTGNLASISPIPNLKPPIILLSLQRLFGTQSPNLIPPIFLTGGCLTVTIFLWVLTFDISVDWSMQKR